MGVANDHSIAWGIAEMLASTAPNSPSPIRARRSASASSRWPKASAPLLVLPCDVEDLASVDAVFETLKARMGQLDFIVHAIGFSDKNELKGRYADTSRENFSRTMVISCFSFTEIAKRAAELMPNGGSMITLTYGGSTRVMPNYNVMGVAKAALEASVRYLAADFGPQASASTRCRPDRCARWPAPALPMRGRCSRSSRSIRRCANRSARGYRRLGAVFPVRSVGRRDRRGPSHRRRLQHHLDAAATGFEPRAQRNAVLYRLDRRDSRSSGPGKA
jgi:NAD(P)-dependent dehydrogenase (short-subunit alcohol dehydrogenase family)